jgi:NitT/TauT family transport system substrate-binding protein
MITYPNVAGMPIAIADGGGFFAREGIKIEYVTAPGGTSAVQAMAAGQVDVAPLDVGGAAIARKKNVAHVQFVSGMYSRYPAAIICNKGVVGDPTMGYPSVMRLLADKTIGVSGPGAGSDSLVRYSLIKAGVTPNDSNIITAGSVATMIPALQTKRIACGLVNQPMPAQFASWSDTVVDFGAGQGPSEFSNNYLFIGLATTEEYMAKNPAIISAMVRALKASMLYAKNPANAQAIATSQMKIFAGLTVDEVTAFIKRMAPYATTAVTAAMIANGVTIFNAINPNNQVTGGYDVFVPRSLQADLSK